ncbi:Bromodomain-containing protein [Schizophyllum commune]
MSTAPNDVPLDVVHDGDHINGDTAPNGVNGHKPNGTADVDSPVTAVDPADAPNHKIDIDCPEPESDVRSEPYIAKPTSMPPPLPVVEPVPLDGVNKVEEPFDRAQDASTMPQVGSPHEPADIDEPMESQVDTEMTSVVANDAPDAPHPVPAVDEAQPDAPLPDEHAVDTSPVDAPGEGDGDVKMEDSVPPESTPAPTPGPANEHIATSDDDHAKPPPAKRPRVHSDADQASFTHSVTPPPASATASHAQTPTPAPPTPVSAYPPTTHPSPQGPTTITRDQFRFMQSTVRSLKKLKDAGPFLRPVDPVALNVPHYPSIIKNPMDFGTIERKLSSSNPQKPDPISTNPRYRTAEEFVADVRLIFYNCYTFNGPDHAISAMGKRVEEVFDKQIKNMPPPGDSMPPPVKKQSTPQPVAHHISAPPAAHKKQPAPRRPSTAGVPAIRRNESDAAISGRPKREIHPPPPKDLLHAEPKRPRRIRAGKDDGTSEQLKFCHKLLTELFKRQYYDAAQPFYEPVDHVLLNIPTYPKIIKSPMDMSTMRRKLEHDQYPTAHHFRDDFKLMIRNCFTFNPKGTPVNQAGMELQRIFDEKWKNLPPLRTGSDRDDDDDDFDEDMDDDTGVDGRLSEMEREMQQLQHKMEALKRKKQQEEAAKKKKQQQERKAAREAAAAGPSAPARPPKPVKTSAPPLKKKAKKEKEDDSLTFDQKKELSEVISTLEGPKLERVIKIIHEGVPEIAASNEEIELEIDLLPSHVLTKLYNFVVRPTKVQPPKRTRPGGGKGTGTGGLKRKSMDEDAEAEKIRVLEQRMALFNGGGADPGSASAPAVGGNPELSDSSSDSDSSGSESE